MQLNRCPICHARIGLEAMAQDEAGRELLGLLAGFDSDTGAALLGYLALFKSSSRDLPNDKALRLTKEVIALGNKLVVTQAMRQTVDSLFGKRGKPLTNHNYLKRVLEDMPVLSPSPQPSPVGRGDHVVKPSKTAQALQALENFGNE